MAVPRVVASASIAVLAGVNGAGKSSIAGAVIRHGGGDYFNPDEVARVLRERRPALSVRDANGLAWQQGIRLLRGAIKAGANYTFETTLGGRTVTDVLERAARGSAEVRIWYAGLSSVELHLARIAARVRRGGHDIPAADVRRRYTASQRNLIRLMPHLTELVVFDNSANADPLAGSPPTPTLLLHLRRGRIVAPRDLRATPEWAKAIVAAAIKLASTRR